ncbi:hypothetical protein VUR80DRAFT_1643 [Thermomyces stellatus]
MTARAHDGRIPQTIRMDVHIIPTPPRVNEDSFCTTRLSSVALPSLVPFARSLSRAAFPSLLSSQERCKPAWTFLPRASSRRASQGSVLVGWTLLPWTSTQPTRPGVSSILARTQFQSLQSASTCPLASERTPAASKSPPATPRGRVFRRRSHSLSGALRPQGG